MGSASRWSWELKKKRPPQAPERLRGRLHTNTVYAITTTNVLEGLSLKRSLRLTRK